MVSSYEETNDPGGRADGPRVRIEPVHWDGQSRVALTGEIDIANVAEAEAALIPMAESGASLVLDLVGLTYCDSQGVAMLFRLARQVRENGGSLTVANPQGIVLRVLEITQLDAAADVIIDL
jgi:anti-sigma B factor antagonist